MNCIYKKRSITPKNNGENQQDPQKDPDQEKSDQEMKKKVETPFKIDLWHTLLPLVKRLEFLKILLDNRIT